MIGHGLESSEIEAGGGGYVLGGNGYTGMGKIED